MERTEKIIAVPGGNIWSMKLGKPGFLPLIALHGGPGFCHDYLEPLQELAREREVILYDQLGCGRSDRPNNPLLWNIPRFIEEFFALVEAYDLKQFAVLGHSWGTILAVESYLARPDLFRCLILGSPCLNIPLWADDAIRLRNKLPRTIQDALNKGEAERDFFSPTYQQATQEYYRRFIYGMDQLPECLKRSNKNAGAEVYLTMWGRNEFFINGSLADYQAMSKLPHLLLPVWYFTGRHDEATPEATESYRRATPDASLTIYENSAHHPHLTEKALFLRDLGHFLKHAEDGKKAANFISAPAPRTQSGSSLFLLLKERFLSGNKSL